MRWEISCSTPGGPRGLRRAGAPDRAAHEPRTGPVVLRSSRGPDRRVYVTRILTDVAVVSGLASLVSIIMLRASAPNPDSAPAFFLFLCFLLATAVFLATAGALGVMAWRRRQKGH